MACGLLEYHMNATRPAWRESGRCTLSGKLLEARMLPFNKDWLAMYGAKKIKLALTCGALLTVGLLSSPAAALQWDLDDYSSSKVSQLTFHADGRDRKSTRLNSSH